MDGNARRSHSMRTPESLRILKFAFPEQLGVSLRLISRHDSDQNLSKSIPEK